MSNLRVYTKRNLRKNFFENIISNLSVTSWIVVINVIFFAIAMIFVLIYGEDVFRYIALKPADVLQGKYLWTFFTSMFMHAGAFHLLINMFVLVSLGGFCEKIIGRKRFFWFYIISGLVAGGLFVALAGYFGTSELGSMIFGSPLVPAVGASGAIFAIAGLFVVLLPKLKFSIIFLPFFSLPAYVMIPAVLFLTWIVSALSGLPVGNTAHFGGFMAGIIYGIYLRNKYSRKVARLNRYIR